MKQRLALFVFILFSSLACSARGAAGTFQASNGKSANFRMEVPADFATKSHGLLIYLHGDGASDYEWSFKDINAISQRHGLIPVAVMSPTHNDGGPSWWWDADANAVFLNELLEKEIVSKYNVDKTRVVFTGISGGSTFLAGPWIRHYASQYRGGAILMCGSWASSRLPFRDAPGFKERFPIFFHISTADFLLDGAKDAIEYHREKGLKVTADIPQGTGHCDFYDQMEPLFEERVKKILAQ